MTISFSVEGTPAPQGSKTRTRYGFRESSKRVKPWREAVSKAAMVAGDAAGLFNALDPPYRVDVWFYILRPVTTKASHPVAPTVGDADKLLRSTFDALKMGGLIEDDRFIVAGEFSKQWAGENETPGAVIRVTELE
jgi:Holliday junction resolvase RusA-like endonuclease